MRINLNTNSDKRREDLWKQYEGLIISQVNKHTRGPAHIDRQDLIQAGYVGLLKAYNKFDNNKNNNFYLFAFRFVRSEIIKCRYRNNKEWKDVNGVDKLIEYSLHDTITANNNIEQKEEQNRIDKRIDYIMNIVNELGFTKKNKQILYWRLNGIKIKIIASKLKLNSRQVSVRYNKCIDLIKNRIKEKKAMHVINKNPECIIFVRKCCNIGYKHYMELVKEDLTKKVVAIGIFEAKELELDKKYNFDLKDLDRYVFIINQQTGEVVKKEL
jgi:RNA polymerase sigma factor (sigma-70 family)